MPQPAFARAARGLGLLGAPLRRRTNTRGRAVENETAVSGGYGDWPAPAGRAPHALDEFCEVKAVLGYEAA